MTTSERAEAMPAVPHGCFEGVDGRTCWDLRYFGVSPVPREEEDYDDQDCECSCHDQEGFEDDYAND